MGSTAVLVWDALNDQWDSVTYSVNQDGSSLLLTTETTIELEGLIGGETAQYTIVASNGLELDSLASDSVSLLLFGDDVTPPTKPTMTLSSVGWTNQDVTLTVSARVGQLQRRMESKYESGLTVHGSTMTAPSSLIQKARLSCTQGLWIMQEI